MLGFPMSFRPSLPCSYLFQAEKSEREIESIVYPDHLISLVDQMQQDQA